VLRAEIGELFYIAPVANVRGIVTTGILSHNEAARIRHASVAMEVIQERRSHVRVSATRMLHDHANLYICGRNPMMFHVVHNNPIDGVCLLRVSPEVLDFEDVVVTDGNASSYGTRFDPPLVGLANLDGARVHARYWTHPDNPIAQSEHKRVKAAEVLVPDIIPPTFILGAYAPNGIVKAALEPVIGRGRDVTLARHPFFDGSGWY
jgi:hypothetical protein